MLNFKIFGRSAISEFLGDRVVYRNLEPVDERLPGLAEVRREIGVSTGRIPRKGEPEYAQAVAYLLNQARALDVSGTEIKRLVFVGDTRMLDGTAFANLCQAGGWPGVAFIGSETAEPARIEILSPTSDQFLYLANRWGALENFDHFCLSHGIAVDEATAVVVDLDKTALGARGRNDGVIDQARVQAVRETVARLLAKSYSESAFLDAYKRLNQPEFHPFTADNQDYLAYISLILGSGLYETEAVIAEVRAGRIVSFEQFIVQVDARIRELPIELAEIHHEIYANVKAGDPTPFKSFRRREYFTTVGSMGHLEDDASSEDLLKGEILITQEVRAMALKWQEQGALFFGLSDKPDEASIPSPEMAAQGYLPIHRTLTHSMGSV